MKAQLLVSQENKMIYGVVAAKGKTHDFKMFTGLTHFYVKTVYGLRHICI